MLIPLSLYAISSINHNKQKPYIIGILSVIIFSILTVFLNAYNERFLSGISVMYFNVVNFIVFDSVYLNSFFALNAFLVILMSMLTKYKQVLLSIAFAIMMVFNIHAGYLFLSRDVMPHNDIIRFNNLAEFKEKEEIFYFSGEIFKLPRVQMALPNTRINVVSSFTDLSDEYILLACSELLIYEIMKHRISVNASAVESGIVHVHDFSVGDNPVILPISLFNSQNGKVQENSITSNGDLGFLVFGPYSRLPPGSYTFSTQFELLNQDEANYHVGSMELTSHITEVVLNRRELFIDSFEDGVLTVTLDLETDETLPDFQIRVISTEGTLLKISNVAMLFIDFD
jgi:hypothetical protein